MTDTLDSLREVANVELSLKSLLLTLKAIGSLPITQPTIDEFARVAASAILDFTDFTDSIVALRDASSLADPTTDEQIRNHIRLAGRQLHAALRAVKARYVVVAEGAAYPEGTTVGNAFGAVVVELREIFTLSRKYVPSLSSSTPAAPSSDTMDTTASDEPDTPPEHSYITSPPLAVPPEPVAPPVPRDEPEVEDLPSWQPVAAPPVEVSSLGPDAVPDYSIEGSSSVASTTGSYVEPKNKADVIYSTLTNLDGMLARMDGVRQPVVYSELLPDQKEQSLDEIIQEDIVLQRLWRKDGGRAEAEAWLNARGPDGLVLRPSSSGNADSIAVSWRLDGGPPNHALLHKQPDGFTFGGPGDKVFESVDVCLRRHRLLSRKTMIIDEEVVQPPAPDLTSSPGRRKSSATARVTALLSRVKPGKRSSAKLTDLLFGKNFGRKESGLVGRDDADDILYEDE